MHTDLEPAMTVKDVAAFLSVDEKTIYRLVAKGDIPGFKVLGSWRFQKLDLEEWIQKKTRCKRPNKNPKVFEMTPRNYVEHLNIKIHISG